MLIRCVPQRSAWALSSSAVTARAGGPLPWSGQSSFQPSTCLGDAHLARWRKCHPGCSRRSRRAGGGVDTVRFPNPSYDFSCGLTLPFVLRKRALSTPRALHHWGETPLCPTNLWCLPFP